MGRSGDGHSPYCPHLENLTSAEVENTKSGTK